MEQPPKRFQNEGCGRLANTQGIRYYCFGILKVQDEASGRMCTLEKKAFARIQRVISIGKQSQNLQNRFLETFTALPGHHLVP